MVKRLGVQAVLVAGVVLGLVHPSYGRDRSDGAVLSLERQTEEVATRLVGVMDTSTQARTNPKAPNVRMTTCRVQLTPGEPVLVKPTILLYQEQALSQRLTKPYRQRFLQISPDPLSNSVRSESFRPANPQSLIGFCNQPDAQRVVKRSDLNESVCRVFLQPNGADYVGTTPQGGCPANYKGAVRITNRIVLHKTGMDTWDRGFNASGQQVWGAESESYQFRRISTSP